MVYWPPYPWYIDPPYPWYINPPIHGILTPHTYGISTPPPPPQLMVFWPPCPCNIDPPTYGISNPLLWYYELLSFGRNEGFKIQWQKIDPRVKIPYMENWTRGQNIICKIFDSTIKDVKKSFKIVDRTSGACFTSAILISLIDRKASYSEPVSYGILNPMVNWPCGKFHPWYIEPPYWKLPPPPPPVW